MEKADNPNIARMHAIVEGRVQGVGFRYFVQENASLLNLNGWVRNRWDGTVELEAEGERNQVEKFLPILKRGPRASFVSRIKEEWLPPTGEYQGFLIRRTQ